MQLKVKIVSRCRKRLFNAFESHNQSKDNYVSSFLNKAVISMHYLDPFICPTTELTSDFKSESRYSPFTCLHPSPNLTYSVVKISTSPKADQWFRALFSDNKDVNSALIFAKFKRPSEKKMFV